MKVKRVSKIWFRMFKYSFYSNSKFKGVLHLLPQKAPKLACFVLYLKIKKTSCWKIKYASYSKLSRELKNSIKNKVDQAVLELSIQNQHFDCFDLQLKKRLTY